MWKRIDEQERLKLQKTVGLGLPVDLAGKIINISSRNANRIMTHFTQSKPLEIEQLNYLSQEQKDKIILAKKDQMQKAELESILDVIKARDQGQISKRNILKMDTKINKNIRKLLRNANDLPIPFPSTLPEQINKCTLSIQDLHRLPKPESPKRNYLGFQLKEPVDLAHWKSLPNEVKEDEFKRMHDFLFQNTAAFSTFPGAKENFMPNPFIAFDETN